MFIYPQSLADHYDALVGDSSYLIRPIKKYIKKYHPKAKTILEVACGTGTILQHLPSSLKKNGLDISPHMLALARRKLPHAKFYQANMINFSLTERFDVIICVFDSINHLTSYKKWEKFFSTVSSHLNPRGIFIFDISSKKRMEILSLYPAFSRQLNRNTYSSMSVRPSNKKGIYLNIIRIYNRLFWRIYKAIDFSVPELAVDNKTIQKTLLKYFKLRKTDGLQIERGFKDSKRFFFICQKK